MNKKSLRKIIVLFAAVIVSCANLFAQTSLPTGYGKIKIGKYDEELDEYEIVSGLKLSDYIAWPDDVK